MLAKNNWKIKAQGFRTNIEQNTIKERLLLKLEINIINLIYKTTKLSI
ncbi:hypothetical protein CLU81_4832 [Flavobacterium sp. 9]|nr:hypothetical protein CLU81_4832 [Flavobacterium sp. 9]